MTEEEINSRMNRKLSFDDAAKIIIRAVKIEQEILKEELQNSIKKILKP